MKTALRTAVAAASLCLFAHAVVAQGVGGGISNPRPLTYATVVAAIGYAPVNKAGDTMTGQLFVNSHIFAGAGNNIGWNGRTSLRASADGALAIMNNAGTISAQLVAEASDVLAHRNGTTPQMFRLYNTYTDGSNYERVRFGYVGNVLTLRGEAAGTGIARPLQISPDGITTIGMEDTANSPGGAVIGLYRNGTSAGTILGVGGTSLTSTALLFARLLPTINQASGTYTVLDINPTETLIGAGPHYLIKARIGAGGNVFSVDNGGAIAGKSLTLSTGDLALTSGNFFMGANIMVAGKRTDPGAPSANFGYIYLRDNGSGKMQFAARFPSGAVQVVATEP